MPRIDPKTVAATNPELSPEQIKEFTARLEQKAEILAKLDEMAAMAKDWPEGQVLIWKRSLHTLRMILSQVYAPPKPE